MGSCVLGPNGTGKTTLLKLLLGILKPSSGEMLLSGMPIGRDHPEACRKLSISRRMCPCVFHSVYLSSYCLDANRGLCGGLPLPMWR
ncbi:MAG: ATP-binding cassette domain-containing protein [Bilophila wadsworthia]